MQGRRHRARSIFHHSVQEGMFPMTVLLTCSNYLTHIVQRLQGVLVNIHDLLNARRQNRKVRRFESFGQFRKYTLNKRTFPKEKAKAEGFIKALLREIV